MAAEAPPRSGGGLSVLTRKVGPLPAWAWAAVLLVGYYLYSHYKSSSSSTASTDTAATSDMNPVPAASDLTDSGLGAGYAPVPTNETVNNYYGSQTAAGQASGGGTSSGSPAPAEGNLASGGTPSKLPSYTLNLASLGLPSPFPVPSAGLHTSAPGRYAV